MGAKIRKNKTAPPTQDVRPNRPSTAQIRNPINVKAPTHREKKFSGAVLREEHKKTPLISNPILRTDPYWPNLNIRDWEHVPDWAPDWKINRTYKSRDRILWGRLPDIERPFSNMSLNNGQIRYSEQEPTLFSADSYRYWMAQKREPYLEVAKDLINKHVKKFQSMIDVEGGPFFMQNWKCQRTLAYMTYIRKPWKMRLRGVHFKKTDNLLRNIANKSTDIAIVLQLWDGGPVELDQLVRIAKKAILVCYPYLWQENIPGHKGLDESWLYKLTQKKPDKHIVTAGIKRRAVALFLLDQK